MLLHFVVLYLHHASNSSLLLLFLLFLLLLLLQLRGQENSEMVQLLGADCGVHSSTYDVRDVDLPHNSWQHSA
jgi:hypothetical protein